MKRIAKPEIKELLRRSAGEWEIYAPLKTGGGDTLFCSLPAGGDELGEALEKVNLRDEPVVVSPGDIFFPQVETMFEFEKEAIKETLETKKKLIFGARPCDTAGILFCDDFFRRNFEDAYYLSRARGRLIITVGCLEPPRPDACFCTSAGTGPFLEEGYDLQFIGAGDVYIVETGSGRGEEFTASHPDLFKPASADDPRRAEEIKRKAAAAVGLKVDFNRALEFMKDGKIFEDNYRRVAERCIYCGACVYACPTCTCFNVFDDKKGERGVRKRNWDACVFEGYTREASGHNPRSEKWLRTARRYEHKLKYDPETAGTSGCVACGRCLAGCPVGIGMSRFIEEITTGKRKM